MRMDDEQAAKPATYQLRCGDQVCGCAVRPCYPRASAQRYVIRRVLVGDENLHLLRPTPASASPDSCAPPCRRHARPRRLRGHHVLMCETSVSTETEGR